MTTILNPDTLDVMAKEIEELEAQLEEAIDDNDLDRGIELSKVVVKKRRAYKRNVKAYLKQQEASDG